MRLLKLEYVQVMNHKFKKKFIVIFSIWLLKHNLESKSISNSLKYLIDLIKILLSL